MKFFESYTTKKLFAAYILHKLKFAVSLLVIELCSITYGTLFAFSTFIFNVLGFTSKRLMRRFEGYSMVNSGLDLMSNRTELWQNCEKMCKKLCKKYAELWKNFVHGNLTSPPPPCCCPSPSTCMKCNSVSSFSLLSHSSRPINLFGCEIGSWYFGLWDHP